MRDGSVVVPQCFYGDKTMKLSKLAGTLTPYTAGEQPREKTVKLNTNENPYPPSPAVERALKNFDISKYRLYPDPTAASLRKAIAEYEGVGIENVFVGNGSDEVLSFAFAAFYGGEDKPVLFADVTYSFYRVFGSLYGVKYREIPLTEDMRLDIESMKAQAADSCGCVFANPNAPTSIAEEREELLELAEAYGECPVIADEAYADFSHVKSLSGDIFSHKNLLVVKTFSKSRSLAGARCGYAIGDSELIDALRTVKNCFNSYPVNAVTAAAAEAAMRDREYFDGCVSKIISERERMTVKLRELGFELPDSDANFVFAGYPGISGEELQNRLRKRGIVVRRFDSPRIKDRLRITVGTEDDTDILVRALEEILAEKD